MPVVPGYIGRAPDGSVATLGRGGSDLTATLLARALGAEVVSLWKDVPGILTSDPRLVPDARLIPQLHHQEAAEVAHYGAKVLHPRALIPISGTRITLEVRSFLDPRRPGTTVAGRLVSPQYPVKAVAVLPLQAVVTVAGKGMVGVHGIAARTFAAVDAERLSVSTIFQASSESSIGFTVPEAEADRAVASLRRAFAAEIATGAIDSVTARTGLSVIAVVGDGMAGTPGIAARVFTALETSGVNVVAIAQGSSERNISVRRHRRGRRRGRPQGARRLPAVEDRRRPPAGPPAYRRGPARLRPRRPGPGRRWSPRRPRATRCASSGCSIARATSSTPAGISQARLRQLAQAKDGGGMLAAIGGRPATGGGGAGLHGRAMPCLGRCWST